MTAYKHVWVQTQVRRLRQNSTSGPQLGCPSVWLHLHCLILVLPEAQAGLKVLPPPFIFFFWAKPLLKSSNHWHPVAAEHNYKCLISESLVCYLRKPKLRWRLGFELYKRRTSQLKHNIAVFKWERAGTWELILKSISVFTAQRGSQSDCAAV